MDSILEETVRRRRRMFSWKHIIEHRMRMKRYREAYVKKLSNKKVPSDIQKQLDVSRNVCGFLVRKTIVITPAALLLLLSSSIDENFTFSHILIDHFRDLPTDSQTTDITHFAVVFNYDVTIEALEIL